MEQDLERGLPVKVVAADRAHDDTRSPYMLKATGIESAIRLNDYRTHEKDQNKAGWVPMKQKPGYVRVQREPYQIER